VLFGTLVTRSIALAGATEIISLRARRSDGRNMT
jgi:hypothetical protein